MLLDMPCPCLFMNMILVDRMLVTYRIKQVSKGCSPPQIARSRYLFKRATQKLHSTGRTPSMIRRFEPKFVKYNFFKDKGVDRCKEVCLIVSKRSNNLRDISTV